ncbi:hypothetical protein B0T20DRAFT_174292 [Sordaria brevicollis]|uniref:Uncharacterized protein n=1 Tax=Sordaria brevicollis TaxID=83679 RepID=A0AAE0UE12_SORBR|nr:hypothetical protein B0T20DRAFT_174292 [Sordaria brevicollis]
MEETTAKTLHRQLRLSTPNITSLIQNVHREISCLDSFSEIRQRFTHTVFVRLSDLDRYLIQAVLLTPSPYIDLSKDNEQEIDEISRLLFLRWSWADAVLRNVLAHLLDYVDHDDHQGFTIADSGPDVVSKFAEKLSVPHHGKFPGDKRGERVVRMLNDDMNQDLFSRMMADPRKLSQEIAEFAVAPHPDDIPGWRLMARQVADRYRPCLRWPGVHFAAAKAGFYMDEKQNLFEHPFYEEWWDEALPAIAPPTASGESHTDSPTVNSTELERDLRAVFDASDVWDVWTLCRMWLCEEALWGVDQEPGTEGDFAHLESLEVFNKNWTRKTQRVAVPASNSWDFQNEFLQRRDTQDLSEAYGKHDQLLTSYLALKAYCPIPEPKEWFFFAKYGNYDFCNIEDKVIVSRLLEHAKLDPQSQSWDLVCMLESKRDQKYRVSNLTHIFHTFYQTDDLQEYCFCGYELPGLCHPCDCPVAVGEDGDSEDDSNGEERYTPEHYKWNHRGGNLVFNRRRLEDTALCQSFDKSWSDWVCQSLLISAQALYSVADDFIPSERLFPHPWS